MTSVENVVSVLRCFSVQQAELTVTEVALRLDWPKSNVSRLLRSMRDAGLLGDAREGRGYCLGAMLLGLGQVAQAGHSLGARADAAVLALTQRCGHAGFVSARVGKSMIGLTHHIGHNPLQVGQSLGRKLPIDACATGRAWLACLSDDAVRELLEGQVSAATPQSPASMEELLARLQAVREQGFAHSRDEAGKGISAIAAAVSDPYTSEVLSLCITFPGASIDSTERDDLIGQILKAKADTMRVLS